MGYGGTRKDAGQAIGKSGDEGIDGIIKEDKLGLDMVYIQAKKWQGSVHSSVLRDFVGALELKGATKGVLITTSNFPKNADEQLRGTTKQIALINGEKLANYMIDFSIGVKVINEYIIKKIDQHPFLVEIEKGILPKEKYRTYAIQNLIYFHDAYRNHAIASATAADSWIGQIFYKMVQ